MNSRFWFFLFGFLAICLGYLAGIIHVQYPQGILTDWIILCVVYWLGYIVYRRLSDD